MFLLQFHFLMFVFLEMIKFIIISNKQGLTRFSKYFDGVFETKDVGWIEADLLRKCLSRNEKQVFS